MSHASVNLNKNNYMSIAHVDGKLLVFLLCCWWLRLFITKASLNDTCVILFPRIGVPSLQEECFSLTFLNMTLESELSLDIDPMLILPWSRSLIVWLLISIWFGSIFSTVLSFCFFLFLCNFICIISSINITIHSSQFPHYPLYMIKFCTLFYRYKDKQDKCIFLNYFAIAICISHQFLGFYISIHR